MTKRNTIQDFFAKVEGEPEEGFDFEEIDPEGDIFGFTEDGEVEKIPAGSRPRNPDEFDDFLQDVSRIEKG